jgi:hypothetical protein
VQAQQGSGIGQAATRWEKPEIKRYKCNINKSFPLHRNQVGFGMCIHDDECRFVLFQNNVKLTYVQCEYR